MMRFAPPYRIVFNPDIRVFDVYLDGKVIGSHKGRGAAEKIGQRALERQMGRALGAQVPPGRKDAFPVPNRMSGPR
jgi:hypothetical protein